MSLEGRHERFSSRRVYGFGSLQFLKDHFKDIDDRIAPNAGIGYKLVATPVTSFAVDTGFGVELEEKSSGVPVGTGAAGISRRRTDAVVTVSDKFEHKLSTAAALTQSCNAL